MTLEMKEPATKASWPPLRSEDPQLLYRYPEPYPVGKEKGESFFTIAKKKAVKPSDLVAYNFHTEDATEINWYLANYVGSPAPKPGQKYYTFEGAVYDDKKNTGVIFIPRFGEPVADPSNRLGQKVVENYNKSNNKRPGGRCYEAGYARVKEASRQLGAAALPGTLENNNKFGRLWGSLIQFKNRWLKLPEEYRGKGAAGAMAWAGRGTLVEMEDIWAGKLKPGAVIQTWTNRDDFDRVQAGGSATDSGHSFIFLNYIYDGSAITGMAVADQGNKDLKPLVQGVYGYWVGANLSTAATPQGDSDDGE